MGEWTPLLVAAIGAIASVGVAFWNSRGESAELRQLKAMNEVLVGLPEGSAERKAFAVAHDEVVLRVANRVTAAPARRRFALVVSAAVVALGVAATGIALIAPQLIKDRPLVSAVVMVIVGIVGVVGGQVSARRNRILGETAINEAHRTQDETFRIGLELRYLRDDMEHAKEGLSIAQTRISELWELLRSEMELRRQASTPE